MVVAALALGALLAVVAVWFVATPFFRAQTVADLGGGLGEAERRRLALEEERDRALGALKELEFDHRTGKVSDDDYRALVGDLRRAAAEALRSLDSGMSRAMQNSESNARLDIETDDGERFPPVVPEPAPVPHEPPGPVIVPEPEPVPHEPPGPAVVPEPGPPSRD